MKKDFSDCIAIPIKRFDNYKKGPVFKRNNTYKFGMLKGINS